MIKDGRKKGLMINEIKISIYSNIPKTYSLGATYIVHKLNAGDHEFMLFTKTFALTRRISICLCFVPRFRTGREASTMAFVCCKFPESLPLSEEEVKPLR